jgi:hypothetical protein
MVWHAPKQFVVNQAVKSGPFDAACAAKPIRQLALNLVVGAQSLGRSPFRSSGCLINLGQGRISAPAFVIAPQVIFAIEVDVRCPFGDPSRSPLDLFKPPHSGAQRSPTTA